MNNPLSGGKFHSWLPWTIGAVPLVIYLWVFRSIALNINYLAFDDVLILGIISKTENVSLPELWHQLTVLFPEHRLVFSRTVVLSLYHIFGRLDLVWLMVVGNLCWIGCAVVFYQAVRRLKISMWYFVPVLWIWFNTQSFENIFWGVSSLCNFGVLLFVLLSMYLTVYDTRSIAGPLLLATIATFTYGNGLMAFPVIGLVCFLTGRKVHLFISLIVEAIVGVIYFMDFEPITASLDFSNSGQVESAIFGGFGFLGSIATISSYSLDRWQHICAVIVGAMGVAAMFYLFRNERKKLVRSIMLKSVYDNRLALFGLSIAIFIGMTALAVIYKRIPGDGFEGVFKGRYRMYSTLGCVALYLCFLALCSPDSRRKYFVPILGSAIFLNLAILERNFVYMVNNRKDAIAQEFNARYNADWLGLHMFSMSQKEFERTRAYYRSEDPLADGWNPNSVPADIPVGAIAAPDRVALNDDHLTVGYEDMMFGIPGDYGDGGYVVLKSPQHVYVAPVSQPVVPFKTLVRRQIYFAKGGVASFHEETIEPGYYDIYLLERQNGVNSLHRTNKKWTER